MKKRSIIVLFIIGLVVILVVIVGASYLRPEGFGPPRKKTSSASPALEDHVRAIPVITISAVKGTLQDYIHLSGDINAASTVAVYPDVSGTIASISVREGDYVSSGQVVGYVDPSRPGASYSLSPVDTPVSGTVTKVKTEIGSSVNVTVPLIELGRLDLLEINAYVSERYVNAVLPGQRALITADALGDTVLEARVSEISPIVDPISRSMEIVLSFVGGHEGVKAGMLADVTLIIDERHGVIKIPQKALLNREGAEYVFVLNESAVVKRPVTTGLKVDGAAEVLDGLEAGEIVVLTGTSMLANGSLADVQSEAAGLPARGNLERSDA